MGPDRSFKPTPSARLKPGVTSSLRASCVILALLLAGCASTDPGSICSNRPVRVAESRLVDLPGQIPVPVVFARPFAGLITLDKGSVQRILREREVASPIAAPRLRKLIGNLDPMAGPHDLSSLEPVLEGLSGDELQGEVHLANEIHVLVLMALERGEATLTVGRKRVHQVRVQQYTGSDPYGEIRGKRFLVAGQRIYDYCAIWPKEK